MPPNPNSIAAEHRGHQLEELAAQIAELERDRDHWRNHARAWEKRAKTTVTEHEEQLAAIERENGERHQEWQRRLLAERYGLNQQDAEQFLNRDTVEENERVAARLGTRQPHSAALWTI